MQCNKSWMHLWVKRGVGGYCGISVQILYSQLEKQQRKLCLVLAVLVLPCNASKIRESLWVTEEIGILHIRFPHGAAVLGIIHAGCALPKLVAENSRYVSGWTFAFELSK